MLCRAHVLVFWYAMAFCMMSFIYSSFGGAVFNVCILQVRRCDPFFHLLTFRAYVKDNQPFKSQTIYISTKLWRSVKLDIERNRLRTVDIKTNVYH